MRVPYIPDRIVVLVILLLVVLAPILIIILTLAFLVLIGDLLLGQLTPLELLELYIIDLVLFAGFAYGLYRLTLTLVKRKLPASMDALERSDAESLARQESRENRE